MKNANSEKQQKNLSFQLHHFFAVVLVFKIHFRERKNQVY